MDPHACVAGRASELGRDLLVGALLDDAHPDGRSVGGRQPTERVVQRRSEVASFDASYLIGGGRVEGDRLDAKPSTSTVRDPSAAPVAAELVSGDAVEPLARRTTIRVVAFDAFERQSERLGAELPRSVDVVGVRPEHPQDIVDMALVEDAKRLGILAGLRKKLRVASQAILWPADAAHR